MRQDDRARATCRYGLGGQHLDIDRRVDEYRYLRSIFSWLIQDLLVEWLRNSDLSDFSIPWLLQNVLEALRRGCLVIHFRGMLLLFLNFGIRDGQKRYLN
jgi:hypothetical protein